MKSERDALRIMSGQGFREPLPIGQVLRQVRSGPPERGRRSGRDENGIAVTAADDEEGFEGTVKVKKTGFFWPFMFGAIAGVGGTIAVIRLTTPDPARGGDEKK